MVIQYLVWPSLCIGRGVWTAAVMDFSTLNKHYYSQPVESVPSLFFVWSWCSLSGYNVRCQPANVGSTSQAS